MNNVVQLCEIMLLHLYLLKGRTENMNHTCCFTGHRPEKMCYTEDVLLRELHRAIDQAIDDGYTTFITGTAKGVDLWAAELVLQERKANPALRLICAVPHPKFGQHWANGWTDRFRSVLARADEIHYICSSYSRSCFQQRNKWMVERSSLVIAAYNGAAGGTQNTIVYAMSKDVEIRYISLQ